MISISINHWGRIQNHWLWSLYRGSGWKIHQGIWRELITTQQQIQIWFVVPFGKKQHGYRIISWEFSQLYKNYRYEMNINWYSNNLSRCIQTVYISNYLLRCRLKNGHDMFFQVPWVFAEIGIEATWQRFALKHNRPPAGYVPKPLVMRPDCHH